MDTEEPALAADQLVAGQWFWHEPVPGQQSWPLEVAAAQRGATTVRIVTTDDVRQVVTYARERRVRLATDPQAS